MPQTKLERLFGALGILAIAALIAVIVPAWLHYRDAIAASKALSTRPEAAATATTGVTRTTRANGTPRATSPRAARPIRLGITAARGDCWLEVHALSATGKLLYEGVLNQGKTHAVSGRKLWIRFGAGANVDLTLNGETPQHVPAGAANVLVTANGIQPSQP
ncbi:MAG: DUF4115 domain-containing protein [Thermoleophilia bacterium]